MSLVKFTSLHSFVFSVSNTLNRPKGKLLSRGNSEQLELNNHKKETDQSAGDRLCLLRTNLHNSCC